MIKLTRSKPSAKVHRFYAMHLAPTLFGKCALVMEWGRIGSPGCIRERLFDSELAAEAALAKHLKIKTRKGYIRASWRTG
ncbi:MAG: WGR domain-containing protein [Acidobacteriaceae bacterium]|nr:WGR domain-containing protein [Acidobacteriaceae bacterium]